MEIEDAHVLVIRWPNSMTGSILIKLIRKIPIQTNQDLDHVLNPVIDPVLALPASDLKMLILISVIRNLLIVTIINIAPLAALVLNLRTVMARNVLFPFLLINVVPLLNLIS